MHMLWELWLTSLATEIQKGALSQQHFTSLQLAVKATFTYDIHAQVPCQIAQPPFPV